MSCKYPMIDARPHSRIRSYAFGKSLLVAILLAGLAWFGASAGSPEDRSPAQTERPPAAVPTKDTGAALFAERLRPVLENTCFTCHGGAAKMADLDMTTRESLLRGGESGPAVIPGNAEASLLYQLIARRKEPFMPYMRDKLADDVVAQFKMWIDAGAAYDRPLMAQQSRPAAQAAPAVQVQPNRAGIEFFEAKIRPVLVDRCYPCHSAQATKLRGGLRLDSAEGVLKGGNSGPVVAPGDPDKSLLIKALRYTDSELQMPPTGKLPASQFADFETWIKMGAPDPRRSTAAAAEKPRMDLAQARKFWSFQPPKDPPIPPVKFKKWTKSPIDHFILAKLEEKNRRPSPAADKRTLIRRATFDLIGLPPKPEEVQAFLADNSPDAFAKVVDRLLASPHYGERWGRYWLDLARYADTKGYVFNEERRYPYSYTYRDWVIQAFNEDLPYDQFLIQQIAADRLPLGDDKRSLAAMGFLTLGRRFLNNIHDIIDDRIDVVTRTTMGLTVGCARCHDHKFDPIPTKDYYSLYGVFSNSPEPKNPPQIGLPEKNEDYLAYQKELKVREEAVARFRETRHAERLADLRKPAPITNYLLAAQAAQGVADDKLAALAQKRDVSLFMLRRWRDFLRKTAENHHPIFTPWHALAALPEVDFPAQSIALITKWTAHPDPSKPIHPRVAQALTERPPKSMQEVAQRYGDLLASVVAMREPPAKPDPDQEALRSVLFAPDAPTNVALAEAEQLFNRADQDKLRDLRKKIDELKVTHPGAPAHAMILEDAPKPQKPHVLMRGNPNNRGDEVPLQFLAVLSGEPRQPFKQGSGRLELARAIASKDNPLTARVMVNRVWLHHFGAGLVRTPSEFGLRSEPPTHPELLDYLARRFVQDGWSVKNLHRLIMLSSVYQQSSDDRAPYRLVDPENRLLWRMNRQRLDFEAMRDALLAVSGQLDETMRGRPVDLITQPFSRRRTIYGFIDRQNLPNMFRAFDFASPDTHSPQRYSTTVPQQALFMMNSPFVIEQARQLIKRSGVATEEDTEHRIQQLYRLIYQRAATPEEVRLGRHFLETNAPEDREPPTPLLVWYYGIFWQCDDVRSLYRLTPWERYAQVLLEANEFVFLD